MNTYQSHDSLFKTDVIDPKFLIRVKSIRFFIMIETIQCLQILIRFQTTGNDLVLIIHNMWIFHIHEFVADSFPYTYIVTI